MFSVSDRLVLVVCFLPVSPISHPYAFPALQPFILDKISCLRFQKNNIAPEQKRKDALIRSALAKPSEAKITPWRACRDTRRKAESGCLDFSVRARKTSTMPWDAKKTPQTICAEIAKGKSVATACEIAGCHPDTFWDHVANEKELSDNYARAREAKAHVRAESIEEYKRMLLEGRIDAQTFRGLLDAVKWQTSKEAPKVYGEKLDVTGIPANQTQIVLPIRERIARMKRANGEPLIARESSDAHKDIMPAHAAAIS